MNLIDFALECTGKFETKWWSTSLHGRFIPP